MLEFNPSVTRRPPGAPRRHRLGLPGRQPRARRQRALGHHQQPESQRAPPTPTSRQVESDAGQFLFDPRNELLLPEKRPFFLDGIEQFTTPNTLIYTRRIVQPVGAAKLTGKGLGTDIALLSAVDDQQVSADGQDHPVYNLLRLQRDVGAESRLGVVYTDRIVGGDYSRRRRGGRAAGVRRGLLASSSSWPAAAPACGGESFGGPLWMARVERQRPDLRLAQQHSASSENFRARSGFFPRPGLSHLNFDPRVAAYGESGALMESVTCDVNLNGRWRYRDFVSGGEMQDEKIHFNLNSHAPGRLGADRLAPARELRLPVRDLRRVPGRGAARGRRGGHGGIRRAAPHSQPRLRPVGRRPPSSSSSPATRSCSGGNDENFYEWARADHHRQRRAQLAADRPGPGRGHLRLPARCAAGATAAWSTGSTSRG